MTDDTTNAAASPLIQSSGSRIDELGSLRYALECIAGKSQWIDNTMSDKQIAKYMLWRLYHEQEEAREKQEAERRKKLQQEKDRLREILSENGEDRHEAQQSQPSKGNQ